MKWGWVEGLFDPLFSKFEPTNPSFRLSFLQAKRSRCPPTNTTPGRAQKLSQILIAFRPSSTAASLLPARRKGVWIWTTAPLPTTQRSSRQTQYRTRTCRPETLYWVRRQLPQQTLDYPLRNALSARKPRPRAKQHCHHYHTNATRYAALFATHLIKANSL